MAKGNQIQIAIYTLPANQIALWSYAALPGQGRRLFLILRAQGGNRPQDV